jgi:hypothetical protein
MANKNMACKVIGSFSQKISEKILHRSYFDRELSMVNGEYFF